MCCSLKNRAHFCFILFLVIFFLWVFFSNCVVLQVDINYWSALIIQISLHWFPTFHDNKHIHDFWREKKKKASFRLLGSPFVFFKGIFLRPISYAKKKMLLCRMDPLYWNIYIYIYIFQLITFSTPLYIEKRSSGKWVNYIFHPMT